MFLKIIIILLSIIAIIGLATLLVLQLPAFGRLPKGERLVKIQASPNFRDGEFQNLSPTKMLPEGKTYWDIIVGMMNRSKESTPKLPLDVVITDLNKFNPTEPTIVWFGHSSYLLFIDGKKILVDPVLSEYASPFTFVGTKRYATTYQYSIKDIPEVDIVLFSHDHYDHLDYNIIAELNPKAKQFIMPLGVGEHLERWGVDTSKISEMDWHESKQLFDGMTLTSTPARHFSGRGFKRNQTLWSSFVLQSKTKKIFIGGDSGYDTHFKKIGEQYGPFDLAILECGQYNELWHFIHMMPEETVQASIDLNAKNLLPVHWAKFSLAFHSWDESIRRVSTEAQLKNVKLWTPKIGEPLTIQEENKTEEWWK